MSPWEQLKSGAYAEAVAGFSEEIGKAPSTLAFNNRGMVYLHFRDYDAALADFRSADALSSASLRPYTGMEAIRFATFKEAQ